MPLRQLGVHGQGEDALCDRFGYGQTAPLVAQMGVSGLQMDGDGVMNGRAHPLLAQLLRQRIPPLGLDDVQVEDVFGIRRNNGQLPACVGCSWGVPCSVFSVQ